MKCLYINLDEQVARRTALEANFNHCMDALGEPAKQDWQLERVPAVDMPWVEAMAVPGRITLREKACFLSHRQALASQLESGDHAWVMEDDTVLSPNTFSVLGQSLDTLPQNWDILFTDVCIYEAPAMLRMMALRNQFEHSRTIQCLDLRDWPFAAASSYIVNKKSKQKVLDLLSASSELDLQIDLLFRALCHQGALQAQMYFPFITSLSDHAEYSQIQLADNSLTGLTWNTLRRLMWVDRSIEACTPALQTIQSQVLDDEAMAYATILAAAQSKKFRAM
jgi:GR25 family glycosyltransferase involved in LPS biosynthesis